MDSWDCLHLLTESLGLGEVTEHSEHGNGTTNIIKKLGISWLSKELLTSRDGLRSLEWVVTASRWMAEESNTLTQDNRIPDRGSNPWHPELVLTIQRDVPRRRAVTLRKTVFRFILL
jgi:hypothetical protein